MTLNKRKYNLGAEYTSPKRAPPRVDRFWDDESLGFSLISCDNARFYFPLELLRYDSRFFRHNATPNTTEFRFPNDFATANTLRILLYKYAFRYQLNSKRRKLPGVYLLKPAEEYLYPKTEEHCTDLSRYQMITYEYGMLYDDTKLLIQPNSDVATDGLKPNLAEGFVIACQNGWHRDASGDVAEAFSEGYDPDDYLDSRYPWAQLKGDGRLIYENVGPEMMQMLTPAYQRGLFEAARMGNANDARQKFLDVVDPDRVEEPNKWLNGNLKDADTNMEFARCAEVDSDDGEEDSDMSDY